ncbi:MAG: hypothetical protein KUL81_04985 [Azonexus sp.]|jgi:cholesterol oxidase|nr:hypothetical protein [Azonexus sp.]
MDDFILIGSGFGGAVTGLELTRAGARVTLLERGPWRDTMPLRSAGIVSRESLPQGRKFFSHALFRLHHPWLPARGLQIHRHGLLEAFLDRNIRVVCASAVGGGSHAYGGLHGRPLRADYWDNRATEIDSAMMVGHYAAILELLGSHPPPTAGDGHRPIVSPLAWEARAHPFIDVPVEQQPAWGYLFPQTPGKPTLTYHDGIERHETSFAEEGMFGSPQGGKTTLDVACLLPAIKLGLTVRDCHEALRVERLAAGGFQVDVRDLRNGATTTLLARRVILAAGAMNSVALLLRSRATGGLQGMPALGRSFGANGDVMAYFPVNTPGANHPAGGIYERMFRHQDDEEGPLLLQAGLTGLAAIPLPSLLERRLRRDLFIAAMGIDAADGRLSLDGERLRIAYDKRNSPVYRRIDEHLGTLQRLGGQRIYCTESVSTVHPLGGARLGRSADDSVVNGSGEVHDVPGLFISDASVLPAAPGAPPSLSIAAWARHVAQRLARHG